MLLLSGCISIGSGLGAGPFGSNDRDELDAQTVTIAKLTAELENQKEINKYFEEELRRTKEDLDYVEQQFIVLEQRLQSTETKASAVATLAEVKLAYEKVLRDNPSAENLLSVHKAKEKIDEADKMLQSNRYAAAVYFAKRAMRLVDQRPDKKTILIVSVKTANVRKGPGLEYEVVEKIDFGGALIELAREGGWFRVRTKRGLEGWIHGSLIR